MATGSPVEVSGWKDTDQEDDEFAQIVDISRNDIIFINTLSVWFLEDGDPETFEPKLMDRSNGTLFKHSLVHIDDALFYLSNNGPAYIDSQRVEILNNHTAGEVWPKLHDGTIGYFHSLTDKNRVRGYYARENWVLADNEQVICHYMPRNERGYGPWKFVAPNTLPIKFGIGAVFNEETFVVYPFNSNNTQFFSVLVPGLKNDDGVDFTLHQKGKGQYVSAKDREKFGEAAELLMFVEFLDAEDLLLILTSDYFRIQKSWTYEQFPSTHILQSGFSSNTFRLNISQPIREGFIGQVFEVEWLKTFAAPYKFIHKGWSLENIIRHGRHTDFISANIEDQSQGNIIETGTTPFNIQETGVEPFEILEEN